MKRLCYSLIPLLVILLLFEFGLRLWEISTRSEILAGRSESDLGTEAAPWPLIYRLKPGWRGRFNSSGFRDVERSKTKTPGVFRIAIVGDSLSMQMDLPRKKLFPARLEALLRRAIPDRRIECPAFAVTGYNASQELYLMQHTVLDFHPDAILWQFHLNDAADPVIDGANGGLGRYYFRPRSYLWAYLTRKLDNLRKKRFLEGHHPGLRQPDLILQAWRRTRISTVLQEVDRLSTTRGVPVLVVLFPSLPEGDDWSSYTPEDMKVYRALLDSFRKARLPVLDLMPILKKHPVSEIEKNPVDRWHLSAEGHLIMAQAVKQWLMDRHFFLDVSVDATRLQAAGSQKRGRDGTP